MEYLLERRAPGAGRDKSLETKVNEAIDHMVAAGADKKDFGSVKRSLTNKQSAFSVDFLHACVHNTYSSPPPADLTATWDNAEPFFSRIWL